MAKQDINIGTPNGQDGDFVRNAFSKTIDNFTELYNRANSYADITALLADQTNQVIEGKYFVVDASIDTTVSAGWGYYRYEGTSTNNINDYIKLIDESSLTLPSGFESVTEGANTGLRIIGKDPANYGNIGDNAVDASISSLASTIRGATGQSSFASGFNTTASNTSATAMGSLTTARGASSFTANSQTDAVGTASTALNLSTFASGAYSLAVNDNTTSSGIASFSAGSNTEAYSFAETSLGLWQTVYVDDDAGQWSALDRVFNVGNGVDSLNRSDAFTILKNGQIGIGINNFEANTTGEILQVNGAIKANTFVGDGSGLTGLPSGSLLQNIISPINAYYGTRLEPVGNVEGFFVDSASSNEIGFLARATNNESEVGIRLLNDGAIESHFSSYGSNFYPINAGYNFLRGNTLLQSYDKLYIASAKNTGSIDFLLGNKATTPIQPIESDYDKVLQLLPNKEILTPFLTTDVINGEATGKIPVTREWIEAQGFGGGSDFSEWATSSGTRLGGDLVTTIGDYDNSFNGTKINIDDDNELITISKSTSVQGDLILRNTLNTFDGAIGQPSITANRNWDFPDASGTIALTSDITGVSKYSETFGDGASLTYNINHAKGTRSLTFSLFNISTGKYDIGDYTYVDDNNTLVTFATAPTLNQYEITII